MTSLHLVPDWAPHSFCWMAWAIDSGEWGSDTFAARRELRRVIATISRFERVRLLTPPHLLGDAKDQRFGPGVEIVQAPVDDIWMRDIAPVYALLNGEPVCIDLNFNAWGSTGLRRARPGDRLARVAQNLFSETMFTAPFIAEGGALAVGHDGMVFTTRSCLLNPNRNPHSSKSGIETELIKLGASKVVWLHGDPREKITSGHIDGYVLPTPSGEILVQPCGEKGRLSRSRRLDILTLRRLKRADGSPIPVRSVRGPTVGCHVSRLFADSYLNVYTTTTTVIAPRFGDPPRDAEARAALQSSFPGRRIEMLSIPTLAGAGGGIRCLVQPVPASVAR